MARIVTPAIALSDVASEPMSLRCVILYAFDRCSSVYGESVARNEKWFRNDDFIARMPCMSDGFSCEQDAEGGRSSTSFIVKSILYPDVVHEVES